MSDRFLTEAWFPEQDEAYRRMFGKRFFALFSDLGTGKTFMLLRDFMAAWLVDLVDAVLIIAPVNVHRQWIEEELPKVTKQKCVTAAWPEMPPLKPCREPRIFTIYPEAFRRTTRVWNLCKKFLKSGRVGLIIDESQMLMHVRSKTTRRIRSLKPLSAYRRISSGFPNPKGMIDMYPQYTFLSTTILECRTKGQFEAKYVLKGGFRGKQIVGYQNEKDFERRVAPHTFTVELDKCVKMPERTWLTFPVELTPKQARLIEQIKKEFRASFDDGDEINMPMALQRLTRMQQIACGFVPKLDLKGQPTGVLRRIPENRTLALENALDGVRGKVLIWSRFKPCIDRLTAHFGSKALCYQGGMTHKERADAKRAFIEDPSKLYLFAQPKSAGAGFNGLTVARYAFYWSNSYDAQQRRQTERRTWRLGQSRACVYGDFIAEGTYDAMIRDVLVSRQSVAQHMLNNIADWALA